MRGGSSAAVTLVLLAMGCGGATTREGAPAGGSAAATPDPDPMLEPSCDCVPAPIAWWRAGGLVPSRTQARIAPCGAFALEQSTDEPGTSELCTSTLEGCGDKYGLDDIHAALAHPDVQAALARAPVVYGVDPRALDGQVDHIEVGDKVIELGDECPAALSDCQYPNAVQNFGRLLGFLQLQERASSGCE